MFEELKEKYPRWMFMSVVGSHNYGTAIEGSDTDVKIAYLPTFEEFYRNSFAHVDTGSPDSLVDYTVHPAHEFLRHAFKGNMNFWEVFFAPTLDVNWAWWQESGEMRMFFGHLLDIVRMNPYPNFNAMRGMATQKHQEAMKIFMRDGIGTDDAYGPLSAWKPAQHSVRMLDTIVEYYKFNRLVLDLTTLPGGVAWSEWRLPSGNPSDPRWVEYVDMFKSKLSYVDMLEPIFKEHQSHVDVRSDRERYRATVDTIMMRLIKENS